MISSEIIDFINQTENVFNYNNIDNLQSIYHYSIPNTKLFYPEPFIASASFMHSDLWFIHILVYQYWLWFVFVFIIVFFFITFISTIRWCNIRIRPRRETRGVSRSKCGDLITACVPVSWATSIIVNESTDAIDYYDGFGTTELVVGIRAYQWGWEYYYPKDIDLNYNIKNNYSYFIGNSLKYNKTSDLNLTTNNLWKFYQNKSSNSIITPAYLFLIPSNFSKTINFLNLNDSGVNKLQESNAFKKITLFSKTRFNDLFYLNYNKKFQNINFFFLYSSNNNYFDNYLYGLKRQHNYLSLNSLFNNNFNFIDNKSFNKILNFTYKNDFTNDKFSFFNKNNNYTNNEFFFNNTSDVSFYFFKNFIFNNNFLKLININSDKKKINNSFTKLFNLKYQETNFNLYGDIKKINDNHPYLINLFNNNSYKNNLNNNNNFYYNFNLFSSNQSISTSNKNIRNFINIKPNDYILNYSNNLNSLNSSLDFSKNKTLLNNYNFFIEKKNNFYDINSFDKLINSKISSEFPYSPISSTNILIDFKNYDSFKNSNIENTPNILQGKEELMPNYLTSVYWNFFFSNSSFNWRLTNNINYSNLFKNLYLPTFFFYYDYDFRNWQSLELLEDSFWENFYSVYFLEEYLNLNKNFINNEYINKIDKNFFVFNKNIHFKNDLLNQSFLNLKKTDNENLKKNFYFYSFFNDESLSPVNLLKTKDFYYFPTFTDYFTMEENYESFKELFFFYNYINNNFNLYHSTFIYPFNISTVLDFFRSDYDEFSFYFDENNYINLNIFKNLNLNLLPLNYLSSNLNNFFFSDYLNNKNNRFSNIINIRPTAKNSIVNYNAIQKVFKTRFDENRSLAKLNLFSDFYNKAPFITSNKTPYEQLIGKNKKNYLNVNLYNNKKKFFFNNSYLFTSSLNFYFFDFPFLLAMKSDPSRYLWFDWYAKWGFYEVQPSSSSRYSITGMPYFNKNFEFNTANNENLIETETYLTRISKARKNYISNWTYTPYFYAKNNYWYKNNIFTFLNTNENNNYLLSNTKFFLNYSKWYWNNKFSINFFNYQFFPSNSNINTYSKTNWKPFNNNISYYYWLNNNLVDILTKREYIYRELLLKKNKIINLPNNFLNEPENFFLNEIKSNFNFQQNLKLNNEYSKYIFYNSLNYFNYNFIYTLLNNIFLNFNYNFFSFFFLFLSNEKKNYFKNILYVFNHDNELYKNQYRPMRKGITNMIRLHATGAMALPTEMRLQLLASSKDVIHSWAIPSAGIKIDCVPGYSSHRVMIFLVSGIFWGQCMEICGRYHHWMPIIVYFMKRDLFFLWCTHFIFLTSGSNNVWNINDKNFTDFVKFVSFDKNIWNLEN